MITKSAANSHDFYLEVSITNALRGPDGPPVVESSEARPSLAQVSKALHEVAEQILEGAPTGHTAISDRFVATWQCGLAQDEPSLTGRQPTRPSNAGTTLEQFARAEPASRPTDELGGDQITEVLGFRVPGPQPVAWASRNKNARPIYRYIPFKPGSSVGLGSWQAAARALKVFGVLHAAHRGPERLEVEDLLPLFFRSSSDLITYREGWKAGRFWSVEAFKKAVGAREKHTNGLISEHVMPRSQALRRALEIEHMGHAAEFVWNNSFECVVTTDENNELTRQDQKRPKDQIWEFADGPWERYVGTSIRVLDVACYGQQWLTPEDREVLQRLGILEDWDASLLNQADPDILAGWDTYVPVTKE